MFIYAKIKHIFLVPLCICLLLASCAHMNSYNTYYNAIECYKGATSSKSLNVTLLDKCVEKCAKILTFYPDSRWVDDALILSGKCFYIKGDKSQAETKFKELLNFCPESEFVPEAEVMLGKIASERGDEVEAKRWFKRASKDKRVKEEVDYWLTHFYFSFCNYERAIEKGELYLSSFKEGKFKADILWILGEAADSLERYEDALNYYNRAIPIGEKKFDLTLRVADIYLKMGDVAEAKKIYNSMEPQNGEEERVLKRKMAFCLESEGDYESAIASLLDIDDQESVFHIAMIHEKQLNLQEALEAYNDAAKRAPDTAVGTIATKKASALQEILTLQGILGAKDTLQFDTTYVDTTVLATDTLQADTVNDTLVGVVEDTTFLPDTLKDFAVLRMRLAEIWLLEFENSDKALEEYRTVLEEFPESEYIPRALYAIAWIEQNTKGNEKDALAGYRTIENDYPDTDYAIAARRQIETIREREEGRGKREK